MSQLAREVVVKGNEEIISAEANRPLMFAAQPRFDPSSCHIIPD